MSAADAVRVGGDVMHPDPNDCPHENEHACPTCDFDGYYENKHRAKCPWTGRKVTAYCDADCGGMSVFDASCECHERQVTRLIQTETAQEPIPGVRVTPAPGNRTEGETK